MRRIMGIAFVTLLWAGVSTVALVWIQLSDALGQEVSREPPWRLPWLPIALSMAWGAAIVGIGVVVALLVRRTLGARTES